LLAAGVDSTQAPALSQMILSLVLPVPMVALVLFTSRRDVMGEFASGRLTRLAAV